MLSRYRRCRHLYANLPSLIGAQDWKLFPFVVSLSPVSWGAGSFRLGSGFSGPKVSTHISPVRIVKPSHPKNQERKTEPNQYQEFLENSAKYCSSRAAVQIPVTLL